MRFAKRLADVRKEKGFSQGELAGKLGIHANVLGRYERGEANPSIEMAARIADVLDISLDYLVGKNDQEVDQGIVDQVLTIQKLPEEDRHCILYALEGLVRNAKTRIAYSST